jgi:hypothetical protein
MPLRKSDRDAIYGICAFIMPFVVHTILLRALSRFPAADTAPWGVTVLEVALSVFAGFAFVIRRWPEQAKVLFLWYTPVMLAALYIYTGVFTGFITHQAL